VTAAVVERHSTPVAVPSGSDGTASTSCAAGEQMLGGGYKSDTPSAVPFASYPSAANTWTVQWHNASSSAIAMRAFAICLQAFFSVGIVIAPGTPDTGIAGTPHPDANTGADCPTGDTLTGGGFVQSAPANGYIWDLRPAHLGSGVPVSAVNSWIAIARATTGSITVTPFAVCASAAFTNPADPHPMFPFTIAGSSSATSSQGCPTGEVLTDGGYWDSVLTPAMVPVHPDTDAPNFVSAHDGSVVTSWQVSGVNPTSDSHTEDGWLVCLLLAAPGTPTATFMPSPTPASLPAQMIERHDSTVTVLPGATEVSGAKCSGVGEYMVGGGYYIAGYSINALASYPSSEESWTATVTNTSSMPMQLTAFVDCLQTSVTVDATIIRGSPISVPLSSDPTTSTLAAALCPDGSVLTGGGFVVSPALTGFVAWSAPGTADTRPPGSTGGNDWLVLAHATTAAMTVTPYAVCAAHHLSATVPHPYVTLAIPASGNAGIAEVCPAGDPLLTSGGFVETTAPHGALFDIDSPASVTASSGEPITEWLVGGTNAGSVDDSVRVYAICAIVTP
jgi:hypothetical protein